MRYFSFILLLLISIETTGQQFPSQIWHDGKVVLLEGDTIRGQIRYSQETDIVELMLKESNTAIALTGRKLLYFEIFDELSKGYREFYALPFALNGNYETPILFEVLIEGRPVSLLSRERIENQVVNSPYSIGGSYSRVILKYSYFFLNEKGKITRFGGSRKDVEWAFKDKAQLIKKYMKQNRIRPEKRTDLMRVVAFYNSLFNSNKTN